MEQKRKQICYRGVEASGSAWHYANDMDEIITAGHYSVCLSHDNLASMGIVTAPCDAEHKVVVQLIVTESAIANKQQHGRVVGQTLVFAACDGATVEILNRTAEKLENGFAWQQWNRMSQKIEVGEVTSLDDCTESGTYNGVFTNGQNKHETFIMVVINNAPVAEASGKVRCISQFKYALGTDSNFSYKTRTGRGDDDIEWGDWVDLGAATTTDIQDGAITAHKLSTELLTQINNNTAAYETEKTRALQAEAEAIEKGKQLALRALFVAAGATYNEETGYYSLNGVNDLSEDDINVCYAYKDIVYNLDKGRLAQSLKSLRAIYPYRYPILQDAYKHSGSLKGVHIFRETAIEIFRVTPSTTSSLDETRTLFMLPCVILTGTFANCMKLHTVYPMDLSMCTTLSTDVFLLCSALKELRLWGVKLCLNIADSLLISKESILYIVKYAAPTNAITITLHPEAYARLADDAEIVAALEAQPLVSLVSA